MEEEGLGVFSVCKKEQRADSQDLEMIGNDSQCVSKVRIYYNSENHRAGPHQAYKQRTICKDKQGKSWFINSVLSALNFLYLTS